MLSQTIAEVLVEKLTQAQVKVDSPDQVHFTAQIASPDFVGKTLLQQHRLVKSALHDYFSSQEIHALSLRTFTPDQWPHE